MLLNLILLQKSFSSEEQLLELCQSFSASIHHLHTLRLHIVPSLDISGHNISVHHFQQNYILWIIFTLQILYLFHYITGDFVIWNNIHVVELCTTATFNNIFAKKNMILKMHIYARIRHLFAPIRGLSVSILRAIGRVTFIDDSSNGFLDFKHSLCSVCCMLSFG